MKKNQILMSDRQLNNDIVLVPMTTEDLPAKMCTSFLQDIDTDVLPFWFPLNICRLVDIKNLTLWMANIINNFMVRKLVIFVLWKKLLLNQQWNHLLHPSVGKSE